MSKFIKKLDVFGVKPVSRLHFGTEETHKSFIGGVCTILIILSFMSIAFIQAKPILQKRSPKITEKDFEEFGNKITNL